MANPPQHKNPLRYLWSRLVGEVRDAVQKGVFEGTVVTMASSFGAMVFTALVPAAAPMIIPIWKFLMPPTVRAVGQTIAMIRVEYQMHTTASGLTVLENPKILTPQRRLARLPSKLTLPSRELIQPPRHLLATPDLLSTGRPGLNLKGLSRTSRPSLVRGGSSNTLTPFSAMLSQAGTQSHTFSRNTLNSSRINQTLNRYPKLRYLNEVEYPSWALNRPATGSSQRTLLPGTRPSPLRKRDDLLKWYMSDRSRATEFKSALRDLSRETEWEDDRGFFERILDKIDDWLD